MRIGGQMTQHIIIEEYFEWLLNLVCGYRYSKDISYRKLLMCLHSIEFTYSIPKDGNRAKDGICLRNRFARWVIDDDEIDIFEYLDGPCSVLEMMIALAVRCEENIMDDPKIGDRTSQWFWGMIASLGLNGLTDDRFDKKYVENVINRFLNRDYKPNGEGGLFTIKNCDRDLRDVEIWIQLLWYLDNIS